MNWDWLIFGWSCLVLSIVYGCCCLLYWAKMRHRRRRDEREKEAMKYWGAHLRATRFGGLIGPPETPRKVHSADTEPEPPEVGK